MAVQLKPKPYDAFHNHLGFVLPMYAQEKCDLLPKVKRACQATKRAKKLKIKVRHSAQSSGSDFNDTCRNYLKSFDARFAAVLEVLKTGSVEKRIDLQACEALAESINFWKTKLHFPVVYKIPKSQPGKYRWIWSFDLYAAVQQHMVSFCIRALMPPEETPPWLYTEKGVPAAIANMMALVEAGNVWVAELDIFEFFPSVQRKQLLPKLPVDKKVVERVAFATDAIPRTTGGHLLSHSRVSSARRGVPQGAKTSAAITTWIMTHLTHSLPHDVHLIVYADNLFLISKTRQNVEEAAKSMGAAVAALPGGHFKLKPPKIESAESAINALGHVIFLINGQAIGHPNVSNIERHERRVNESLFSASQLFEHWQCTGSCRSRGLLFAELAGLKRYLNTWRNFFPHDLYEGMPNNLDPAWSVDQFMGKRGIDPDGLSNWENGKVRIEANPSRLGHAVDNFS